VVKYFVEIKLSAQKELDALDDALFARIAGRFWRWPTIRGPQDAKS
jgi:hypothetical protein